jgi:hypothetical protein
MAPCAPIGRKGAMALVKKGEIPFQFGSPHPFMCVVEQEGKLRIRRLEIDAAESKAASEAALAKGESWMPEHYYSMGKPVGKIFAEASSAKELLALMEKMDWPAEW